jgi:hypothetical protein
MSSGGAKYRTAIWLRASARPRPRRRRGRAPGGRRRRASPTPRASATALAVLATAPASILWRVPNTGAIVEIDVTAADAVETLCDQLDTRGVVLALARVKRDLLHDLRRSGLADRIGPDRISPTLPTAVAAFQEGQRPQPP